MTTALEPAADQELADRIRDRWQAALTDFEKARVSVFSVDSGVATGRSGTAVYRLSLDEAALIAARVALADQDKAPPPTPEELARVRARRAGR